VKLSFYENNLIIDTYDEILPFQIEKNLIYEEFKEEGNRYIYHEKVDLRLTNLLIKIFEEENISLTLDSSIINLIKNLESREKNNKLSEKNLIDIKENKYDVEDYKKFVSSCINMKRTPFDHQLISSYHMFKSVHGANFSVPGSGKTTCVLTVYNYLMQNKLIDYIYIIGPLSCYTAWLGDYEQCFGIEPSYNILSGGDHRNRKSIYLNNEFKDINLSSYQTVSNDYEIIKKFFSKSKVLLVLDEAHKIKSIDGKWSQAILNISDLATYRVVLSGTPMPQSYQDLYNIFKFLHSDNSPFSKEIVASLSFYENNNQYEKMYSLIQKIIYPYFYRVKKNQLNLASQIEHKISVNMMPIEKEIYDCVIDKFHMLKKSDSLHDFQYLQNLKRGRMIRLRQIFSHCGLLKNTVKDYDENLLEDNEYLADLVYKYEKTEKPGKLTKLLEIVKDHVSNSKKIVIWSNFIQTIKIIEKELSAIGISNSKIIGETPSLDKKDIDSSIWTREKIVNDFNNKNGKLQVLIANPQACSEAISLHKDCCHSIYYDLSYDCAQYLQSLDRIHRVGGSEDRDSHYYFLQYTQTREIEILDRVKDKSEIMHQILNEDFYLNDKKLGDNLEIEAYENIIEQ